jgi:hypothetical protein
MTEAEDDPGGQGQLSNNHLPQLFKAAESASAQAQTHFFRLLGAQLGLLLAAAVAGAFTWQVGDDGPDLAGAGAVAAFAIAVMLRALLFRTKPERAWHDGRAIAESAKTLAWRYSVGANPFPVGADAHDIDNLFVTRVRALPDGLSGVDLIPTDELGDQITAAMRALRGEPLAARRTAYEVGRVQDQQAWYAREARRNRDWAAAWNWVLVAIEIAGFVGGLAKALAVIDIDLLAIAAAAVAGVTAWQQAKQHERLASAYSLASQELASIRALVDQVADEDGWSDFVDQSEEAISREHTMWRASRSDRRYL